MTIPLRSVVRPDRDPDDLPYLGGLVRAVVGSAAALVASAVVLSPTTTLPGSFWAVPVVLPTVLIFFWPVDVLTRRLPRWAAGLILAAVGALVLGVQGLLYLGLQLGFWGGLGLGAGLGAAAFVSAFLAAERFGGSKVAGFIAAGLIFVAAVGWTLVPGLVP